MAGATLVARECKIDWDQDASLIPVRVDRQVASLQQKVYQAPKFNLEADLFSARKHHSQQEDREQDAEHDLERLPDQNWLLRCRSGIVISLPELFDAVPDAVLQFGSGIHIELLVRQDQIVHTFALP